MTAALATLFHPFETGDLPVLSKGQRVLFLGAEPGLRLPEGWGAVSYAVQPVRPSFRALQATGLPVAPFAEGSGYDAALVLTGRHRGRNELWVAEALERTVAGGLIVVAGGKEDGILSLRKRLTGSLEIDGSEPKYHGVVFWLRRPDDMSAAAALRAANPERLADGHRTAPGMFSPDHVDPGSRLLMECLPGDVTGEVADFGAGWGYLAAGLLRRNSGISRMDLYEADFQALEAARTNVGAIASNAATGFFWIDLLAEPVGHRYDFVVMNPPFHAGRGAEPAIGRGMIAAAARALKPGGRLFLVANRQLPYEQVLADDFRHAGETVRDASYKVLWAVR
ncbi:MAG: class I SAM-dependent methyltransferase [Rhizobiaceae bacterium]